MGCHSFLVAIGIGIAGKIAEFTVAPVIRQVGYVIHYNKNLKKLESQVGDLGAARESMQHAVETEERKGRRIETGVRSWLTKVDEMTEKANNFLNDDQQHAETRCLRGFCPNLKVRHHRSRKSTKLVQEVADLCGKKDFGDIAYDVKPEEVCSIRAKDYQTFDSRTSVAEKIMNELRQSETDMIGVYGIGGVGKTTLAKEVYRQATEDKTLFDDVVIVLDVKKSPDLEGIQKRIAEKLGMEFLGDETIDIRASRLFHRIKDKKVLVILDDIQEKVDLEILGLPRMSNCKVLLTSRTREVLSVEMRTQKEFPLDLLDAEENWSLFEKMAGGVVQNPAIGEVAKEVAQKCGGLPVLVVTVASALKNRSTLHDWKDALQRLRTFDKEGLAKKAYLALEWSYEQLDDEELKSLFLLSGIMRTEAINLDDLLKYSMGLGLIKNVETMEKAQDALHALVEKLKDSCLLLENSDDNKFVRMHDLVHEVVNGIARDQHVFKVAIGDEFKEWPTKDFCTKSTMIVLKMCSISHLPQGLECPELKMFTFSSRDFDHCLEIPSNFFEGMKKLTVLDLTRLSIPSLPASLQFLESLQTLCLDYCTLGDLALVGKLRNLEILSFFKSKFRKLPEEIGQLTRLRLLDLNGCSQLEVISPNVLSNLKRLENLRMGNSFNQWEGEGVISSERRNANLEELKHLPQLTALQIHIPDANILPADLFTTSKLKRFQICIGSAWKWDNVDEALNALKLRLTASNELDQGLRMLLERTEDLYLEGTEGVNNSIVYQIGVEGFQKLKHLHLQTNVEFTCIINGKIRYPNLSWLEVNELNGLRFLLSSSMARSLAQLTRLQISGCQIMEEIVSVEESDEEIVDNFFCQLQILELKDLPNLTKFCSRNYTELSNPSSGIQHFLFDNKVEFPNLKELSIGGLAKLTTIWNNQFSLESSKNLETIEIVSCDSLKSIFPVSMVRNLKQLKRLIVKSCGVQEIVAIEEGLQTPPMFVFPKVTYVIFDDLSQLANFYPDMHVSSWPLLNSLGVCKCGKVDIFVEEISSFQEKGDRKSSSTLIGRQSLFSIEKDSFPNLEWLAVNAMEFSNGPLPAAGQLFSKLKHLDVCCPESKSVVFLDKLLDPEGNNSTSSAVGIGTQQQQQLPHLKELWLIRMYKLMHLGQDDEEDNSQSAPRIPNFPNLQILSMNACHSLRNLRSSTISFNNLTSLRVSVCYGLEYLMTYSMAKSLMQLTKLEVEGCPRLVEIVGSNENGDSRNEITFRRLKHLKLLDLPRLQGFCSGNCIAKFPCLETSSMSNRLKLKIFTAHDQTLQLTNEEADTDVDAWEAWLTAEDKKNSASTDSIS